MQAPACGPLWISVAQGSEQSWGSWLGIRCKALGRRSESEPLLVPGCQQRRQGKQRNQANAQRATWAPRSGAPLTPGRLGCPQRPGTTATHQASCQAAIRLNRPTAAVGTGHRSGELQWEGPFQAPWIIWVIRLISPHLPYRVRQPQGQSDGRNERCCSLLRVCSYRAGFSHPPYTPSKPLQPLVVELSGIEPLSEALV